MPDRRLTITERAQIEAMYGQGLRCAQIAGWLRSEHPDQPERRVSHETIHQAIYFQPRGELRREVDRQVALRSERVRRRPQSRAAARRP